MNTIVKTVNFHIRKIYRIRRFITVDSCHQLVRSLILSRLDYANSLLYGIAAKDRRKLQKLQNKAAKVIFRCDRLHPSAPLRRELHWLPINERVIFKVLLLTFKGVNNLIPAYLSDFSSSMSQGEKICALGMNIFFVFHVPNVPLVTVHFVLLDRASGTPSLPYIRFSPLVSVFKKSLKHVKTHLFPILLICFLPWYHIVVF